MEVIGEPRIDLQLSGRSAVGHVIDPRILTSFDKLDERTGGIVPVNLIDPARAVSFENGFAGKKFAHEDRAARSVETRKSRDRSACIQRDRLSLQQYPAGFAMGSRFAGFINP